MTQTPTEFDNLLPRGGVLPKDQKPLVSGEGVDKAGNPETRVPAAVEKRLAERPVAPNNAATCQSCGCSWFETIKVAQIDKSKWIALGQQPPKLTDEFSLLRCLHCGEKHEPSLTYGTSWSHKVYKQMLADIAKLEGEAEIATEPADIPAGNMSASEFPPDIKELMRKVSTP